MHSNFHCVPQLENLFRRDSYLSRLDSDEQYPPHLGRGKTVVCREMTSRIYIGK